MKSNDDSFETFSIKSLEALIPVDLYVCAYIHTHKYKCTHRQTYTHIHTQTQICVHTDKSFFLLGKATLILFRPLME